MLHSGAGLARRKRPRWAQFPGHNCWPNLQLSGVRPGPPRSTLDGVRGRLVPRFGERLRRPRPPSVRRAGLPGGTWRSTSHADGQPGSGPLLDRHGHAVGVLTGARPIGAAESVTFAVPIDRVRAVLQRVPPTGRLATPTASLRRGGGRTARRPAQTPCPSCLIARSVTDRCRVRRGPGGARTRSGPPA
jgi:hypothetical protein